MLQWAQDNGCPWDKSACVYEANEGHLKVLQWACANSCPWDKSTCTEAAKGGHLACKDGKLQWTDSVSITVPLNCHGRLLAMQRPEACRPEMLRPSSAPQFRAAFRLLALVASGWPQMIILKIILRFFGAVCSGRGPTAVPGPSGRVQGQPVEATSRCSSGHASPEHSPPTRPSSLSIMWCCTRVLSFWLSNKMEF
jgi:hypothetical protein